MSAMSTKNIIVLCDGTWNGASVGTSTNIARLHDLIPPSSPGITNVLGNFQGVGTGESIEEFILNGALAQDLDCKIKEVYKFVVTEYNKKDQCEKRVWLFGFSRGAYTVRSVAGMINNCGIVNADLLDQLDLPAGDVDRAIDRAVDLVYSIYRKRDDDGGNDYHPRGNVATRFRDKLSYPDSDNSIVFMGLWDTVGANGLPSYGKNGFEYLEFHDKTVSSHIDYVYQAVAVHENIAFFEHCPVKKHGHAANTVEERWFPGIHLDIGGFIDAPAIGWPIRRSFSNPISDATLQWMIENINNAQPAFNLGGIIVLDPQIIEPHAGCLVTAARRTIKRISNAGLLRLIIRDRDIPFSIDNPAGVLYGGGINWNEIANPADYSSRAYIIFHDICHALAIPGVVPWFG